MHFVVFTSKFDTPYRYNRLVVHQHKKGCDLIMSALTGLNFTELDQYAFSRGGFFLDELFLGKEYRLVWKCGKGHQFETSYNIADTKEWCPKCQKVQFQLKPEHVLLHTLEKVAKEDKKTIKILSYTKTKNEQNNVGGVNMGVALLEKTEEYNKMKIQQRQSHTEQVKQTKTYIEQVKQIIVEEVNHVEEVDHMEQVEDVAQVEESELACEPSATQVVMTEEAIAQTIRALHALADSGYREQAADTIETKQMVESLMHESLRHNVLQYPKIRYLRTPVTFKEQNEWTAITRQIERKQNWVCRTPEVTMPETLICWVCSKGHEFLYTLAEASCLPSCKRCARKKNKEMRMVKLQLRKHRNETQREITKAYRKQLHKELNY